MHIPHSILLLDSSSMPLLDSKFDADDEDVMLLSPEHHALEPVVLVDDLTWEDQLDMGEEVSM